MAAHPAICDPAPIFVEFLRNAVPKTDSERRSRRQDRIFW